MPSKKSATKKSSRRDAKLGRFNDDKGIMRAHGGGVFPLPAPTNGGGRAKQPRYINPETREEREKRLAERKALTLKAFEIAYENHHRRKAS